MLLYNVSWYIYANKLNHKSFEYINNVCYYRQNQTKNGFYIKDFNFNNNMDEKRKWSKILSVLGMKQIIF